MSQNSDSSLLSEKLCLLLKTGSREKKIINRYFRKSYIIYLSFIWLFIVTFWARLFSYYIFLVAYITLFCLLLLQTIWLQRNLYLLLYISNWDRLSKCHVWCESNNGVIVGADEGNIEAWLAPWQVGLGGEQKLFPKLHLSTNIYNNILILLCDPFSPIPPCIPSCCPGRQSYAMASSVSEKKTSSGQVKVLKAIVIFLLP